MHRNRKIATNTAFLYVRMLVVMGTSLYTVRVVFHALGVQDFGIYGVAAALVTLLAFLNATMSQASQRFLSLDIGNGDLLNLGKTFNAILAIHVVIAIAVVAAALSAGSWFLNEKMAIPHDRIASANLAYQFAAISGGLMIVQTPYSALIVAHEKMWFFSLVSLLEAGLRLFIAWAVANASGDRLSYYSMLMCGSALAVLIAYVCFARLSFAEARIRPHREQSVYRALTAFITWSFIGNLAGAARTQGVNLLLNVFFGPVANAAHGIMTQAQTATNNFANSFQMALNPQIYQRHAKGEYGEMRDLVIIGSKLNFILLLIIVVPVLHATPYILEAWLSTPPPMAVDFIRWMLVALMIDSISQPLITAAMATGKIRAYQLIVGGTIILSVPLSYAAFRLGYDATAFLYVITAISLVALLLRLLFLRNLLGFPLSRFVLQVLLPATAISAAMLATSLLYTHVFGEVRSLFDFAQASSFLAVGSLSSALVLGLSRSERRHLFSTIGKRFYK